MEKREKDCGFYQGCFIVGMCILVGIWLICLVLGDENQLNVFFLRGQGFFSDFVYSWTASKDPYNWTGASTDLFANYPPLACLLLYPFSKFTVANAPLLMGLLLYSFSFSIGLLLIFDNLKTENKVCRYLITILFLGSSAFLFSFERGNIIVVSAVLALFFLFEYDSESRIIRELSYIALAISAGIKLYPAILGILIIKRKRYMDAVRTILYGLMAFFLPFLFFKGGFQCIPIFIRNIGIFGERCKFLDHPAFNFKYFANGISDVILRDKVYQLFMIIDKIMILIAVISAYMAKEKWKEVMILSISIIWFSIHSGFYMGMFFVAGIVFFLNDAKKKWINDLYFIFIIMILNPLQIMLKNGRDLSHALINIGASCLVSILILDVFIEKMRHIKIKKSDTHD